jgi:hypothetical protein
MATAKATVGFFARRGNSPGAIPAARSVPNVAFLQLPEKLCCFHGKNPTLQLALRRDSAIVSEEHVSAVESLGG